MIFTICPKKTLYWYRAVEDVTCRFLNNHKSIFAHVLIQCPATAEGKGLLSVF